MIVAPSILALDFSRMQTQVDELNASEAQWLHFDVMDGHFVPNLSFGPDILRAFCRMTSLYKDVHLMVSDPVFYSDVFLQAGAENITFHYEAVSVETCVSLSEHIHSLNRQCGISIRPGTPVDVLKPLLPYFDLVLVMSVEPGFGNQSFQEESLGRIAEIKKMREEKGLNFLIEVDGGINDRTAPLVKDAGADVLVAGSYVFRNDVQKAVKSLV